MSNHLLPDAIAVEDPVVAPTFIQSLAHRVSAVILSKKNDSTLSDLLKQGMQQLLGPRDGQSLERSATFLLGEQVLGLLSSHTEDPKVCQAAQKLEEYHCQGKLPLFMVLAQFLGGGIRKLEDLQTAHGLPMTVTADKGPAPIDLGKKPNEKGFLQGTGRKRALIIGINYLGIPQRELPGAINDAHRVREWLFNSFPDFNDKNTVLLSDDQTQDPGRLPDRANCVAAMQWLVKDAKPGDSLFFHFSGHGVKLRDKDGDETDGWDEAILPMDYRECGAILDDEMFEKMVKPLAKGVQLTAIFDCCYSGSALDLPFIYTLDSHEALVEVDNGIAAAGAILKSGLLYLQGDDQAARIHLRESVTALVKFILKRVNNPEETHVQRPSRSSEGTVILLSSSDDHQVSVDVAVVDPTKQHLDLSGPTGAASWAFIQVLSKTKSPLVHTSSHSIVSPQVEEQQRVFPQQIYFTELLKEMRHLLKDLQQTPQLSSSYRMRLHSEFCL